jgi:hypothetical protein
MIKRKPLELSPEIARRFYEDLRVFHAEKDAVKADLAPARGIGAQPFSEISSKRGCMDGAIVGWSRSCDHMGVSSN